MYAYAYVCTKYYWFSYIKKIQIITHIDGEYPADANPWKNLPAKIIGKFWDEAIKTHPRISGIVRSKIDFLLPNFEPSMAAANPPKMAPSPNIAAKIK
jgi:hypothetical protein